MELIDIHSHILHKIDDGSKNLETSIEMLKLSYEQGVKKLILTPHFNNHSDSSVERFLRAREKRFLQLKEEIEKQGVLTPELYLGAEVTITTDMAKIEGIEKLAIEGTNYILVEMPYTVWQDWMYDCLFNLISSKNLTPIIAHVERYFDDKNTKKISDLAKLDVYFQINATSVLNKKQLKNIIRLVNNNLVYFMASDTHDLTERPPKLLEAFDILEKKTSYEFCHFLTVNANLVLENESLELAEEVNIPKTNMSIWDKLFNSSSI